jgi:hypothetical protein
MMLRQPRNAGRLTPLGQRQQSRCHADSYIGLMNMIGEAIRSAPLGLTSLANDLFSKALEDCRRLLGFKSPMADEVF